MKSQQTLPTCGIIGSIFMSAAFSAAEAEFVAQIHSHLCDTASKKKQHYGELNLTPQRTHAHPQTNKDLPFFCNFKLIHPVL